MGGVLPPTGSDPDRGVMPNIGEVVVGGREPTGYRPLHMFGLATQCDEYTVTCEH